MTLASRPGRSTVALLVNPAAARGRAARQGRAVREVLEQFAQVTVLDAGTTSADSVRALRAALGSSIASAGGSAAGSGSGTAAGPGSGSVARLGSAAGLAGAGGVGSVDAVVVCGGDGAVHLAANVLAGGQVPLGVVPAGSGNDVADMLGMDRDPIVAARQIGAAIAAGAVRRIDLGRCDGPRLLPGVDRAFVGLLYAGFDSAVNERANRLRVVPPAARYNVALAVETVRLGARRFRLTLDEEVHEQQATLVAVGNGAQYGRGKRIAPHATWDDGLFGVTIIDRVTRRTLARLAPTLPRAGHVGHPAARFVDAAAVRLESPDTAGLMAYADGEPIGPLPVSAWVERAALPVLVP